MAIRNRVKSCLFRFLVTLIHVVPDKTFNMLIFCSLLLALLWCQPCKIQEVLVNGQKQGVTKKDYKTARGRYLIHKIAYVSCPEISRATSKP